MYCTQHTLPTTTNIDIYFSQVAVRTQILQRKRMKIATANSEVKANQGPDNGLFYVGRWTREEEHYVEALIDNFRAGNISGIPAGITLRLYLAKMLMCRVKRVSKRYERTGYNGRAQYVAGAANLALEESEKMTEETRKLRLAFLVSRDRVKKGQAYVKGTTRAERCQGIISKKKIASGQHQAAGVMTPKKLSRQDIELQRRDLLRRALLERLGATENKSEPPKVSTPETTSPSAAGASLIEVLLARRKVEREREDKERHSNHAKLRTAILGVSPSKGTEAIAA